MFTRNLYRLISRSTGCIVPTSNYQLKSFVPIPTRRRRRLATVATDAIIIGPPPDPPATAATNDPIDNFDRRLLSILHTNNNNSRIGGEEEQQKCLKDLVRDYFANSGRVLERPLKYESRPGLGRKLVFEGSGKGKLFAAAGGTGVGASTGADGRGDFGEGVVMVAHCVKARGNEEKFKVVSCSGFVIDAYDGLVVTCAHTFEQIRRSPLNEDESGVISGSFVITPAAKSGDSDAGFDFRAVTAVPSCLPGSDVLLLRPSPTAQRLRTLPVSPYPLSPGRVVRAHFVKENPLSIARNGDEERWESWIGGTYRSWVKGVVKGYRDFAGREAKPGTYDALNHMLFSPTPTPGSSGGPVVDEESGAVVGVILGSRMDNRVEGITGCGVPSEILFEMFSLPGLEGKK